MAGMHLRVALSSFAVLATATCALAADRAAVQRACFPTATLAGLAGEAKPVKGAPGSQIAAPASQALPPIAPLPTHLRGAIRRVELPKGRKLVALSLDLCEQPGEVAGYDGPIFDYLRASGTKATLFVGGKWFASHPQRSAQLIADPLFEIGVHGWAHRNVRRLEGAALVDELVHPLRAFQKARDELAGRACAAGQGASLPQRPAIHRFAYGACNPAALNAAAEAGLMSIQWDVSTGDPSPTQSARAIAEIMVRQTKPGSIVIAHANGRGHHTAEALPLAIPKLKAMGFEFVTVGELLAAGRPVIVETCYDNRPGDTDKYDFLYSKRPAATGGQSNAWRTSVPAVGVPR